MRTYSIALCLLAVNTAFAYQQNPTLSAKKEDSSVVVRETIVGNVKVIAEAKNIDEASQFRDQCKSKQKKRKSERNRRTGSEKDEKKEENCSPQVSLSFKWPARD